MLTVRLASEDDFEGWRAAARQLVRSGVPAGEVDWRVGEACGDLFGGAAAPIVDAVPLAVPRGFIELAETAALHRAPDRFALLHALLARLHDGVASLADRADPLVHRIEAMAKAVRRDVHKMRAFVRFRQVEDEIGERYVAWFEPEHHIVRANAGFFMRRFATMRWSILTPAVSLHWDGEALSEGPAATRADAPDGDPVEATWRTYYAAIFNPARLKRAAMLKEMPRKYWRNMPETALIPDLVAGARAREQAMVATGRERVREGGVAGWDSIRHEAEGCTRCPLFRDATQTVFGEGPLDAPLMLIGEQPGDQEDEEGRPFVGPAGQLLDRALEKAGVDRSRTYVTNAVKHFKFERRGKRRIHSKPNAGEIEACRWWLDQEREIVGPKIILALGATAARGMLGKAVTISGARDRPHALADGGEGWVTVHPSYLLRLQDEDDKRREYARFVDDLRAARERAFEG